MRRRGSLRAATALLLIAGLAHADPDPWLGEDKALHFGLSSVLAIGGYTAATSFSASPTVRLAYGGSVALLAGVGKELWDASGHGTPSWKDLTWDVVGAVAGLAISWAVDTFVAPLFAPRKATAPAAVP